MPDVLLKPKRALPFFARHPWVFAGAIEREEEGTPDGAAVTLRSSTGQFIAHGLYNSQSKIRVRLYSWSVSEELTEDFWSQRLERAILLRHQLGLLGANQGCRLVFSEGDNLSGLIADKFGDWIVLQVTSLAIAQRLDFFAHWFSQRFQARGVYLRTEKGVGKLEGLALQDKLYLGEPADNLVIREGAVHFQVDLETGQKTGFYNDQRENHLAVSRWMAGRRVLDAFCYTGGFGLHCAYAGAKHVTSVDVSQAALTIARENASRNSMDQMEFVHSDVFDYLQAQLDKGNKFDGIILDPPKFARDHKTVPEALRGYRRLIKSAVKLADKETILVMCCCSGLIRLEMIEEILAQSSSEAGRDMQIIERRGQAADHPVNLHCPETFYLKCIICRLP